MRVRGKRSSRDHPTLLLFLLRTAWPACAFTGPGDSLPHISVRLNILHAVIVHNTEMSFNECLGDGFRDFGLGLDYLSACLLGFCFHFLFEGDGHSASFFGFCLRHFQVGRRLVDLPLGAALGADVHVRNVNGKDFKRRTGVEAPRQHHLGDLVRIFEHLFVRLGRTYGGNNPFTYAREDRVFAGTADKLLDVSPDRYACDGNQLNPVGGNRGDLRRGDHLGVYRYLNRLEHVASGQVDRCCLFEGQVDVRFVGRDERADYVRHVPSGQIMSFEFAGGDRQTRLGSGDQRVDDDAGWHLPDSHPDEFTDRDFDVGEHRRDPQSNGYEVKEDKEANDAQEYEKK